MLSLPGITLGLEAHLRKRVGREEIWGFEVFVTKGVAGVNACRIDGDDHRRGSEILAVEVDSSAEVVELAVNIGNHHMLDGEANTGVCLIDLPGGRRQGAVRQWR